MLLPAPALGCQRPRPPRGAPSSRSVTTASSRHSGSGASRCPSAPRCTAAAAGVVRAIARRWTSSGGSSCSCYSCSNQDSALKPSHTAGGSASSRGAAAAAAVVFSGSGTIGRTRPGKPRVHSQPAAAPLDGLANSDDDIEPSGSGGGGGGSAAGEVNATEMAMRLEIDGGCRGSGGEPTSDGLAPGHGRWEDAAASQAHSSVGGHVASSAVGAAAGTAAVLAALRRGAAAAALRCCSARVAAVAAGALGGAVVGELLLGRAREEDVETDADVMRGMEEAADQVVQRLRAAKAAGGLRRGSQHRNPPAS